MCQIPEIPFTANSVKQHQQDGDENALAITLYSSAAEGLDTKFCINNEVKLKLYLCGLCYF